MALFGNKQNCLIGRDSIIYYRGGQGDPVIFIHGITTYSFIWRNVVPYFLENHDTIVLDLLGCGESDKPLDKDISIKSQAHILREFVSKLRISRFHLITHDVGGGIGQIFAVNYPEQLYTLTLINTVAYNFWPVQPIIAMRTPIIRQLAIASLDLGLFGMIVKRGLYHKSSFSRELMEFFWMPMKSVTGRKGFLHFAKCLDNTNLTEIEDELRKLRTPVLIIRGEADVYLSASISEKLHSELPDCRLIKIKSGGHFIQEDEPELLAFHIKEFIRNSR